MSTWRPLVADDDPGPQRAAAEAALLAIAQSLRDAEVGGALDGAAGVALLFGYLGESFPDGDWDSACQRHLDSAGRSLATEPLPPSLWQGLSGIGWMIEHLQARAQPDDETDLNQAVDAAVAPALAEAPYRGPFDLLGGAAGIGVYALERLRRPSGRALLARVVTALDERARPATAGMLFAPAPPLGRAAAAPAVGSRADDLGVGRGLAGVLPILAAAAAAGVETAKAIPLLERAVGELLMRGQPLEATATSWCLGEPGVAAALAAAALRAGRGDWLDAATFLGRRAVAALDRATVADAGLCHGAAGMMLCFQRLGHATGDEEFYRAARLWLDRTLAMHQRGRGVGGYRAWDATSRSFTDDPGLFSGAAGIGLALLSARFPVEPDWDRVLALSC